MDAAGRRIELCRTADVAVGTVLKVDVEDLELAVFNLDGSFYVTDDHCTHGPGSLSDGDIHDDAIECNFHGGMFSIKTGEVVGPPCIIPVRTYQTIIDEDKVFIIV